MLVSWSLTCRAALAVLLSIVILSMTVNFSYYDWRFFGTSIVLRRANTSQKGWLRPDLTGYAHANATWNKTLLQKKAFVSHPIDTSQKGQWRLPDLTGFAHGCPLVYIDLGANIGVQVRKLFEPELYPNATITGHFDRMFGESHERTVPHSDSGLCVFGFEANPAHIKQLKQIEGIYNAKGWHVMLFVPVAVLHIDGEFLPMHVPPNKSLHVGATFHNVGAKKRIKAQELGLMIPTFDLVGWLEREIIPRTWTQNSRVKPSVVMKMDIEGSEYEVLPLMLEKNILCMGVVDLLFVEWHVFPRHGQNAWLKLYRQLANKSRCLPGKITEIIVGDDESYQHDGMPLEPK